ncbi:MAG: tRNA (adenosine(37)-N6)-threonylcarbamoyltransferase complex dimerization subunit type 1 TsaB [Firmicutes bacterium]|nr:tRNA (adenosine(37)-N6)-threonylcarbamoyltransferase complex dimerization subunit type 1 TsaB [Bacillota bacterium]
MILLAIEAAAKVAGACVLKVEDGKEDVLGDVFTDGALTHSQTLMPMVDTVLKKAGLTVKDMDYLALTAGPGSFTGLRIGAATVKGLSLSSARIQEDGTYSGGKKIVPVGTLESLCYGLSLETPDETALLVGTMDARRSQVYAAVYQVSQGHLKEILKPEAMPPKELADFLLSREETCIFAGDAADLYEEFFRQSLGSRYRKAPDEAKQLSALSTARLAVRMLEENPAAAVDGWKLELTYLRRPQAERERSARVRRDILLRPMKKEDIPSILAIEEENIGNGWSEESLAREMENDKAHYLVADLKGEVIGYAGYWQVLDEGHIMNISVRKDYRTLGLGRLLMDEMIHSGTGLGILYWTLEVRKSNEAAIHLYESIGFSSAGVRPGYYANPKEDALILWLSKEV